MYGIPLLYNPGRFDIYVHKMAIDVWVQYVESLTRESLTFFAFSTKGSITKMEVDHQTH